MGRILHNNTNIADIIIFTRALSHTETVRTHHPVHPPTDFVIAPCTDEYERGCQMVFFWRYVRVRASNRPTTTHRRHRHAWMFIHLDELVCWSHSRCHILNSYKINDKCVFVPFGKLFSVLLLLLLLSVWPNRLFFSVRVHNNLWLHFHSMSLHELWMVFG